MTLLRKYLAFVDRYVLPDHPRGGPGALRDFQIIWGAHFLFILPMIWLVGHIGLSSGMVWWLQHSFLLIAFIGFPTFAAWRHGRIRNSFDRRFDEMPGLSDLDGHPMDQVYRKLREKAGQGDQGNE